MSNEKFSTSIIGVPNDRTRQTDDNRALIAMSGGVDSSVACLLMQEAGFDCHGVTMRLLPGCVDDGDAKSDGPLDDAIVESTSPATKDELDASAVADALGIPFTVADLRRDFARCVIKPFIETYEFGATPNPCIDCNRTIKFGRLLQLADTLGCEILATGHYARVVYDEESDRYLLKKALDATKDQSYMLYSLTQEVLSRVRFPLGEMTKQAARDIAESHGFTNAQKSESQDICFVPDGDYAAFIEEYTGKTYPAGDFLTADGTVVGTHKGQLRYTKGQRKGLGIALGTPVYVLAKDAGKNAVTVGPESALFEKEATLTGVNFIPFDVAAQPIRVMAQTRYRKKEAAATLYPPAEVMTCGEHAEIPGNENPVSAIAPFKHCYRIVFDEPQRAMTPGQSVVFYDPADPEVVIGGGVIVTTAP